VKFEYPNKCPSCSEETKIIGQFLYCTNKSCPSQLLGTLKTWIKKLNILNWGDAVLNSLVNSSNMTYVNDLHEIYDLSAHDLSIHCSGMKMATKLYNELHSKKNMTYDSFLGSLNIRNLSTSTSHDVYHHFQSQNLNIDFLDYFFSMSLEDLLKVPNVGPITANDIFDSLSYRKESILSLASKLTFKEVSGPLIGKTFCITGATSVPRNKLESIIEENGGIVKDSVGSSTDYLITNETNSNTSKMQKAKKYNVTIIDEAGFQSLLSGS